jgi:hypothetical protein
MPRFKAAALARHEFLMLHFASFPRPNSARFELRFTGNLPRAATLQDAIDAAMTEAGMPVPEGSVEVTPEQALQIPYLQKLFVKFSPETIVDPGDASYTTVFYSFGFSRKFQVLPGVTMQRVLDANCKVEAANPVIAGIRGGRDEVYGLMHVALRKCADSSVTSAAWNAMHIIDSDTRNWMVNIVVAALGMQEFSTSEQVVAVVKKAFETDDDFHGNTQRALIRSLFGAFSDNDWTGLLSYCIIWPHDALTTVQAGPNVAPAVADGAATPSAA